MELPVAPQGLESSSGFSRPPCEFMHVVGGGGANLLQVEGSAAWGGGELFIA